VERRNVLRILRAIGQPDGLDVEDLRHDLDHAGTWFLVATRYRTGRPKREARLNLQKLSKAARRLQTLLRNERAWELIAPFLHYRQEDPRIALDRLVGAVDRALEPPPPPTPLDIEAGRAFAKALGIGELSPFEWLVGRHLPKIFEKHFGEVATARRAEGTPNTRYLRFAGLSLAAMSIRNRGRPYSPESIVRAMTLAKHDGARRRGREAQGS
jgi:hypothetical protein